MGLFKIFSGKEKSLPTSLHDGYVYFTDDTGKLYIDIGVTDSTGTTTVKRVKVNAHSADKLLKRDPETGAVVKEIEVDDLLLNNASIDVSGGGTGQETLTVNALLIGNGTDPIKMVPLEAGAVVVGDSTNGVAGLKGKGVLYDTTTGGGSPQFGVAPVEVGGTGKASITAGAILKGAGTNAVEEITGTGVLYSTTANNPQLGTAPVQVGGTGKDSFTAGAILKGNGTDGLQEVSGTGVLYAATNNAPQFGTASVAVGGTGKTTLTSGAILKGNGTGAVAEVSGTGVLFASSTNNPQFGVAPLTVGGTGGNDASSARTNLSVYSKQEVDDKAASATSTVYATTLFVDGWTASEEKYIYNYTNSNLKCGSTGTVPPIITYTSNQEEYSLIESAVATQGTGIIFTTATKPTADIAILIVDIG